MNSNIISKNNIKYYNCLNESKLTFAMINEDLLFFKGHNLLSYVLKKNYNIINNQLKEICLIDQLRFKKKVRELNAISKLLESIQVDYRVIKGIGIAVSYPEPYTRVMGDFDILVHAIDYERTLTALLANGYEKGPETEHDIALIKIDKTKIELHFSLLDEEREKNSHELLENIWEKPRFLDFGNSAVKVPNDFWHYRYILLHMMKHLKYRGFGLRFLIDLVHFTNYYNIKMSEHIHYFEEIGYGYFYKTILYICNKYFGLDFIEELKNDINLECVEWLENYILESGTFGRFNKDRRVMDLYEQFTGKTDWSNNSLWMTFFPKKDLLSYHYSYAKKHTILLPIAWGHRLIKLISRRDLRTSEKYFFFTKDKKALKVKERMMKYLGLWK